MIKFRNQHPIKRPSPKNVKKHTEYKLELKADFHSRCGYCNDSDEWVGGWRFFQIDHFVPQKYLNEISVTEYSNLIYSCFFCNNSKRAKWPSENEGETIKDNKGFIHPKSEDYSNHLTRDLQGKIIPCSPIGEYMIKAMKLNLIRHSIFWNYEKLAETIENIESIFNQLKIKGKLSNELQIKVAELLFDSIRQLNTVRAIGNE